MEDASEAASLRPARRLTILHSTRALLRATTRWVLNRVFPWTCVGCGTDGEFLCPECRRRVLWLHPPWCSRCGLPLGSSPSRPCSRCGSGRPPPFRRLRACTVYRSSPDAVDPVARAIRAMKYERRRAIAGPLSELFADRFPYGPEEFDLLVPVPLHVSRLRERGFNQAVLLAREPSRRLDRTLEPRALERTTVTPFQVGLDEAERRRNLRGAIRVRRPDAVRGKRVVLVDDVATTLATAEICARELRRAGAASVDVAVLGRTLFQNSVTLGEDGSPRPSAFGTQPPAKKLHRDD